MFRKSDFLFGLVCTQALAVSVPFLLFFAFGLDADALVVCGISLAFATLYAFCFGCKRPFLALAVTILGLVVFLWNRDAALQSFVYTVKAVSDGILNSLPDFSHLESKLVVWDDASATHMLALLGVVTGAFCAVGIFSRNRTKIGTEWIPAVFVGVSAFLAALIQTVYEVPAWPVLLFLGAWLSLVLTKRSRLFQRGSWHWLVLPVGVLVVLCFLLTTVVDSDRILSTSASSRLKSTAYRLSPIKATEDGVRLVRSQASQTMGNAAWNKQLNQADLTRVGPNSYSETQVMSVKSSQAGLVYLRGSSLGTYTGTNWKAIDQKEYGGLSLDESLWISEELLTDSAFVSSELTVRTAHDCQLAYVPLNMSALPDQMTVHLDAYIANPQRLTAYTISLSGDWCGGSLSADYAAFVRSHYLQIPEATAEYLSSYFQPEEGAGVYEILDAVAKKFDDEKTYDRQTRRMTRGSGDFVVWFLSQSETGYCIHFASAATMILRNCGIPARLVTGYLTSASADQWTIVRQGDAHAWVEYYVDGIGWQIFDPTPAGDGDGEEVHAAVTTSRRERKVTRTARKETPDAADTVGMQPLGSETAAISPGLLVTMGLASLYLGWFFGIRLHRRRKFSKGSLNQRSLAVYRWILIISRVDGVLPPARAEELALKARFSRDGLSQQDADEMLQIYTDACDRMHIFSEFGRAFVACYILAL